MEGYWGYYIQGNGKQQKLEEMGSKLSVIIDCPVHYPAFDKNLFECKHGIVFPVFAVGGAVDSGDWSLILKQHRNEPLSSSSSPTKVVVL